MSQFTQEISRQKQTDAAQGDNRTGSGRIRVLDGIRGVAVLFVLACHLETFAGPWSKLLPRWFLLISRNLWIGVDLFFVLSGFLITGILLDSKEDPPRLALRSFYVRRVLRIFPLYYVMWVITFVAVPAYWGMFNARLWEGAERWSFLIFVPNLLVTWWGVPIGGPLAVAWSLAIEEQFYLAWPWLVRAVRTGVLRRLCLAMVVFSPLVRLLAWKLGANLESLYVFPLFRLDGLAAGAWLAVTYRETEFWNARARRSFAATGLAAAILYVALIVVSQVMQLAPAEAHGTINFRSSPLLFTLGYAVSAVGFTALIGFCILSTGYLVQTLSSRWLRDAGKYSYCIYLTHVIIGYYLVRVFGRLHYFGLGTGVASLFVFIVVFSALVYGTARLSWRLIESPALRLKRFFPY